jgi:hypothetical protein
MKTKKWLNWGAISGAGVYGKKRKKIKNLWWQIPVIFFLTGLGIALLFRDSFAAAVIGIFLIILSLIILMLEIQKKIKGWLSIPLQILISIIVVFLTFLLIASIFIYVYPT